SPWPTAVPWPNPTLTVTTVLAPTSTPAPALPPSLTATPTVLSLAEHDRPRYTLRFWLDPARQILTGTVSIDLINHTESTLPDIALRLYPNIPDEPGAPANPRMVVTRATVNDLPVTPVDAAQGSAILLPLAALWQPDEPLQLELAFEATVTPWSDGSWPLVSYYPLLAVYQDGDWRLDVTTFPDRVFSESAFYDVAMTLPDGLDLISSGRIQSTLVNGDGTTTYTMVAGPVRQFALVTGQLACTETTVGAIQVRACQATQNGLDIALVVQIAADALTVFEQRFGPYPYDELDLQLLPYIFDGGDEFPGLILVYTDDLVDMGTRSAIAHEVAHQWWFAVVGNDIIREAWLDESLAQYSAIIYAEDVLGPEIAWADWQREVLSRYNGALADGDLPIGLPIDAYPNFSVYYRTVYGKGAVFLQTLRQQLGDAAFFQGLQTYYQQRQHAVATGADLQQAWETASGQDLDSLFATWVTSE
ncbi:MAG: M1 family metallopeptidase, partial [Chloroflexaceae bacterium]|nr:M1 family metallopeptidase [Chloroflexaceae bacterium]